MSKEHLEKLYFISFNIIACLVFILFSAAVHSSVKSKEENTYWIVHSYEVSHEIRLVTIEILQSELLLRNYFLTERKSIKSQIKGLDDNINQHLLKIQDLVKDNPEQSGHLTQIKNQYHIFIDAYERLVQLYDENKISRHLVESMQKRHFAEDQLENLLNQFYSDEQVVLKDRVEQERASEIYYRNTVLFGAMLSVVLLVFVNTLIYTTIARQRRRISTLLESADLLKALIDNMNDGVWDYNVATRQVRYSQSFYRQLGYEEETDVSGLAEEGFNTLVHPDDRDKAMQAIEDYLKEKTETYQTTLRLKHHDGSWRWMLSRGFLFHEADQAVKRMIGINTDITEQKNQQFALQEVNEELENFTYIASHDMRSPLVNLKGFTTEIEKILQQILQVLEKGILDEKQTQVLKNLITLDAQESSAFIHSAIERLQYQTEAILKLSRIGRHNYQHELVSIQALVHEIAQGLEYELREKHAGIVFENLPDVVSDPLTVQQIFGNIIENSVKYLELEREGRIIVRGEKFKNETLFTIEDNGRGIDVKDQKKVFDIFRRARNSGNVRGSGMGLAYVRTAMRKVGGRIWFESVVGKGTIFYLTFPNRSIGQHDI